MLTLSANGEKFIMHEEGTVLHVYKDQRGYDTVGTGHLVTAVEKKAKTFTKGITLAQAQALFEHDVAWAVRDVNEAVKVLLSQSQFDALTSFTFNVGPQWIKSLKTGRPSSMLVLLNQHGYAGIPAKMAQWVYSGGIKLPVLEGRRQREGHLWSQG